LLVLDLEGHGLRNLVAKAFTESVQIPGASDDSDSGVDSLNVSVTGGIILWHFAQKQRKASSVRNSNQEI
jgi:21S rRNA (GM2251-2'-O)-methyltransferase